MALVLENHTKTQSQPKITIKDIQKLSEYIIDYFTSLVNQFGNLNSIKILHLDQEWYKQFECYNHEVNTMTIQYCIVNKLLHGRFHIIQPNFHMDGYFNEGIYTGVINCFGTYEGVFEKNKLNWATETYAGHIWRKIELVNNVYDVTEYLWASDDVQTTYKLNQHSQQIGDYKCQ